MTLDNHAFRDGAVDRTVNSKRGPPLGGKNSTRVGNACVALIAAIEVRLSGANRAENIEHEVRGV
ncbi:hypothetical protein GCM10027563_03200 [Parasphingorhabdus pacifica]